MGGGGSSGPTLQQQQLQTEQALTNASLNLEENSQRKSILNAMMGTRVFKGSALSRAIVGNTPGTGGEQDRPAPSASQISNGESPIGAAQVSLLDQRAAATPAGGVGASAGTPASVRGANPGGPAR